MGESMRFQVPAKLNWIGSKFMSKVALVLRTLRDDESGQDLIEYALVAGLIGLGGVAAMSTLSSNIATTFNNVGSQLTSAV
jgi:pilus assembly protein Flp/PilA